MKAIPPWDRFVCNLFWFLEILASDKLLLSEVLPGSGLLYLPSLMGCEISIHCFIWTWFGTLDILSGHSPGGRRYWTGLEDGLIVLFIEVVEGLTYDCFPEFILTESWIGISLWLVMPFVNPEFGLFFLLGLDGCEVVKGHEAIAVALEKFLSGSKIADFLGCQKLANFQFRQQFSFGILAPSFAFGVLYFYNIQTLHGNLIKLLFILLQSSLMK